MQNVRIHGGGIAECPNCGAEYRVYAAHADTRVGFDCFACGERLDESVDCVAEQYKLFAEDRQAVLGSTA